MGIIFLANKLGTLIKERYPHGFKWLVITYKNILGKIVGVTKKEGNW